MRLILELINYEQLNKRQQESYNFQQASAVLAEYGYTTIRLSDDWQGADFIAQHVDGKTFLKVQLKGRLTIDRKYEKRDIYVCFRVGNDWYLYPHDKLMRELLRTTKVANTKSWTQKGSYSWPGLSRKLEETLKRYRLKRRNEADG